MFLIKFFSFDYKVPNLLAHSLLDHHQNFMYKFIVKLEKFSFGTKQKSKMLSSDCMNIQVVLIFSLVVSSW